jgi:hypothetical protein
MSAKRGLLRTLARIGLGVCAGGVVAFCVDRVFNSAHLRRDQELKATAAYGELCARCATSCSVEELTWQDPRTALVTVKGGDGIVVTREFE